MGEAPPILHASGISKCFGALRALDNVELMLEAGEVHGLLGENGSGKSTLIKVLAGYHEPARGAKLEVAGRRARLPLAPGDSARLGLGFVHQELGLIPSLSVVENLLLGELATTRRRISWRAERARARERLARHGLHLDPDARVADLRPLERAGLAIARAMDGRCRVLVLDEPTAFLPQAQRHELFGQLRELADGGAGVLLTSHELAEARAVADRVTVLREGRNVGTVDTGTVDDTRLMEMVVGRPPALRARGSMPAAGNSDSDWIRALSGHLVRGISIDLPAGEVVGLAGLPGSGHDEVTQLLFGARAGSGRLRLESREHDLAMMTPSRALRARIALVPADRLGEGGVGELPVADNLMLPSLARYGRGLLPRRRMLADAARLLDRHGVAPADPELPFGALSGGNQQKALLAKWLHTRPALLMFDEPLRGVDPAARELLVTTIRAAAREGTRVLAASADHAQLSELCDRVVVFAQGTVVAVLAGDEVTSDRVAELCH